MDATTGCFTLLLDFCDIALKPDQRRWNTFADLPYRVGGNAR